jgi:hypothetical protein
MKTLAVFAGPAGSARSPRRKSSAMRQQGEHKFDPAGRANTSDPGSVNSGATNAAGQPVNPMANPEAR